MFRVAAKPACGVDTIARGVSRLACAISLLVVTRTSGAQTRSSTTSVVVDVPRESRAWVHPDGAADPQLSGHRCEETCTLDLVPGEYVVEYSPLRPTSTAAETASRRFTVGRSPIRVVNRGRPVSSTVLMAIGGAGLTVGAVLGLVAIFGSITHFGPDPTRDWTPEAIAAGACFGVGVALFVPGVVLSNPIAVDPLNDGPAATASRDRRVRWAVSPGTVGTPFGVSVAIVHF